MPKKQLPKDPNQAAKRLLDIITGEKPSERPDTKSVAKKTSKKNQ